MRKRCCFVRDNNGAFFYKWKNTVGNGVLRFQIERGGFKWFRVWHAVKLINGV